MTRPASHRKQLHPKRCSNCRFCVTPTYKDHDLCVHGDSFTQDEIASFWLLDGYEYDRIWGGRVVDWDDVCDEWQPQEGQPT